MSSSIWPLLDISSWLNWSDLNWSDLNWWGHLSPGEQTGLNSTKKANRNVWKSHEDVTMVSYLLGLHLWVSFLPLPCTMNERFISVHSRKCPKKSDEEMGWDWLHFTELHLPWHNMADILTSNTTNNPLVSQSYAFKSVWGSAHVREKGLENWD